jgi:pimeloyl-ACP methyl ester carboxylesterase
MLDEHDIVSYLNHDGERIAFHGVPGASPGLFFLHGFRSEMTASKAEFVAALARTQGPGFTRFDYSGHGRSSGAFEDGTIGSWLSDSLAIFDQMTMGPQIVIGSSMGGWLGLLLAIARPERVRAVIGIAAAPDFTEDLLWEGLSSVQQQVLMAEGRLEMTDLSGGEPYILTKKLIESGREHLLLRNPIAIQCPVRLLHGMADMDVPWQTAVKIAERVTSTDVRVDLVKDAGHRFSRDTDLALLRKIVEETLGL